MAPLPHMLKRSAAWCGFNPAEFGTAIADIQKGFKPPNVGQRKPLGDLIVKMLMHLVTHSTDETVQGTKHRQCKTLLNETLNSHIDEIGGIAHRVGRLLDLMSDHTFAAVRIRRDLQIGPNREAMTVAVHQGFRDPIGMSWQAEL